MIRIISANAVGDLVTRKVSRHEEAENVVRKIIEEVRAEGDRALLRYARVLDGFDRDSFRVEPKELDAARAVMTPELREAVHTASANIRAVAELQLPESCMTEMEPGRRIGQIVRPVETICAYVPSGRYPLVSTLMMTVIPAQVAGVGNICVTTPRAAPEILGTASLLGLPKLFLLGGAQAIAAFALGTETIPRADRIVGPGNVYVTVAKKILAGEASIDFVAGPTEIVIIACDGNPVWIAADMLAQAEHDTQACALLLTTSASLASAVAEEIEKQLSSLSTASVAREAIERNSAIILVDSVEQALELSNRYAPEHLSIDDSSLLEKIDHAGSVFVGPNSPEAAGDYASGPNHVLPTAGAARWRGGLSAADFVKVISVQELSSEALQNLAPAVTTLARAEGLEAHARSVEVRRHG